MPSIPNVSPGNIRGLLDKIVGLAEEVTGSVFGNERLTKRGQLHQEAGSKRLEALAHAAKATKERGKAAAAEQGQRAAERSKQSA